jgi:hypothetical protein
MMDTPKSIGMATMDDDGTIILDLRAEGPNGLVGIGRLIYAIGHPQYQDVLNHVGGLAAGDKKPVPPWDD